MLMAWMVVVVRRTGSGLPHCHHKKNKNQLFTFNIQPMKNYQFFFVLIIGVFLLVGCQEKAPDVATAQIDVATAEKMVRDFNVKFQQHPDQVMEQNTSDDYVFINGEGGFVPKTEMTEISKSLKIAKWDLENLKVRVLGNVFVATGVNNHTVVGNEDGNATDYQTAFTYIYQEKGGNLELVSMHHSHVQKATGE
jgi:hypothetical protein